MFETLGLSFIISFFVVHSKKISIFSFNPSTSNLFYALCHQQLANKLFCAKPLNTTANH